MSKFIEHRPDNCPDQPRFTGGPIVVGVAAALMWSGIILLIWLLTHS